MIDFSEDAARANGIKFSEYSARALAKAIRKALAIYEQPGLLRRYRQNAMKTDFSWEQTVGEYLKGLPDGRKIQLWTRFANRRARSLTGPLGWSACHGAFQRT